MTSSIFDANTLAQLNGVAYKPAGAIFAVDGTLYIGAPGIPPPGAGFSSDMVYGMMNTQDGLWDSYLIPYPAAMFPMGPSVDAGVANLTSALLSYAGSYYAANQTYDGMVLVLTGYSQGAMITDMVWQDMLNPTSTINFLQPYVYRIYNFGDPMRCFPPGTLVRMADGTDREIELVRPGDVVVSAQGNARTVLGTASRIETNELVSVNIEGNHNLRCTADHRVLTTRGYVEAQDLTADDWVALPRYAPMSTVAISPHAYVSDVTATGRRVRSDAVQLPNKIELDGQFGRLIGLYCAEGSAVIRAGAKSSSAVSLDFHANETSTLASEVIESFSRYGGVAKLRRQHGRANSVKVTLSSVLWAQLMSALCGMGADGKSLHPDLLAGGREFLCGVLDGWLDGDGHRRRGSRVGTSVSRALAMNMYNIAQALGLKPTISTRQRDGYLRSWDVCVNDDDRDDSLDGYESRWGRGASRVPGVSLHRAYAGAKKWRANVRGGGRSVELGHFASEAEATEVVRAFRTRNGIDDRRGRTRSRQDDTHVWRRFKSLTRQPYFGPVYDIEVEHDHSLIAEGVGVHNCPGIARGNVLAGQPLPPDVDSVVTGGIGGPTDLTADQSNVLAPDGNYVLNSFVNPGDLYADCPVGANPWGTNTMAQAGAVEYSIFKIVQNATFMDVVSVALDLFMPLGTIEAIINGLTFAAAGPSAPHYLYGDAMVAAINDCLALGNSLPHQSPN